MRQTVKLLVIAFLYLNSLCAMKKNDAQETLPDLQVEKEKLLIKCKAVQFPKPGSPRTPDQFLAAEELKTLLANNFIKIEKIEELKALLANNLITIDDNRLQLLNNEIKLAEENSKKKLIKVEGRSLGNFARCPSPDSPRESEYIAEELRALNVNNLIKKEIEGDDNFSNEELTAAEGNKLKLKKVDGNNLDRFARVHATLKLQNGQILKTKQIDSPSSQESSREPSPEHPLNNSSDDSENT